MRRKISFYIDGQLADLDDQSFILFNYTMEDLTNPTIVKNSLSQQITLQGTPRNNKIFGDIHRNDRMTVHSSSSASGVNFNPATRTPFVIYNELDEILEEGYLKLDGIRKRKSNVEYKVTLYGGLGSFLYGLSYNDAGEKLTLADLDYGVSLGFTISRNSVSDAWARIGGDTSKSSLWDIINFIGTGYEGIPASPFDANKCVVRPFYAGLKYRDGNYGTRTNGLTLVTLNEKVTGNEARDYRSYLQKPCIKMSKIIDAICDPTQNGGYTVNLDSDFFDTSNPYWNDTWLTLPLLSELNIDGSTVSSQYTINTMSQSSIVGGGGSGNYQVTVNLNLAINMSGIPASNFKWWCRTLYGNVINYMVVTLNLYDSSSNLLSNATYRITTSGLTVSSAYPQPDMTFHHVDASGYLCDENGNPVTFPIYAEAYGATYMDIDISWETYSWGSASWNPGDVTGRMWILGESDVTNNYGVDDVMQTTVVNVVGSSVSTVRTGASVTQSMLLKSEHTPADYLLSFCKTFGLHLVYHKGEKVVDILTRKTFYGASPTTVDIDGRVDRKKDMDKVPFMYDARWYSWLNAYKGEYAENYANRIGLTYGKKRVNTGYDFDASEKSLTDGVVFSGVCDVTEASKYYCTLIRGSLRIPSVFLAGGTYNLYNGEEVQSYDIPTFGDVTKTWLDTSYPMVDGFRNLQFHNAENAHLSERDTLVFFTGMRDVSSLHLSLTDDTSEMLTLNANVPCWLPYWGDYDTSCLISQMPHFSRVIMSGSNITKTLDFGTPLEVMMNGVTYMSGSDIYNQFWEAYITDRYDDDSCVVTCHVDFRGMAVNEDLFRQFYFFDGSVWALNKIVNYSLTTWGSVECEFVRVQDIDNYIS